MTHDPFAPMSAPMSAPNVPPAPQVPSETSPNELWDAVAKRLDALSEDDARVALSRCCNTRRWVDAMLHARPVREGARLERLVDEAFATLEEDDWLEAFAAHPRIGEQKERLQSFAHPDDSEREQSGVRGAHAATLASLADGNRRYEEKFNHVFLVCATGKTADQMLAILRSRLANTPEAELRVAAGELVKITRLRLAELR